MSTHLTALLQLHRDLQSNAVAPHELTELVFELMEADEATAVGSTIDLLESLGLLSQLMWLSTYFKGDLVRVRDALASYLSDCAVA